MTQLEIEAFFEILKAGSISCAAQNLYVTQPALSRRIKVLEAELGYPLFERNRGKRNIVLTKQGEAFIAVAHKWLGVWQEAQEIKRLNSPRILNLSSVGSVSSYILPDVFEQFSQQYPQVSICFHNYHSYEAYQYIDSGLIDIAFISDHMYYKNVETIPAFFEPMVFVANNSCNYPDSVSPAMLKPSQEILLPWNPEYDAWHDYWFRSRPEFEVSLDQMDLLEHALLWKDTWAIVPASVADKIVGSHVSIHYLSSPPPDRIIYYLKKTCKQTETVSLFLKLLHKKLETIPQVTSYLSGAPD